MKTLKLTRLTSALAAAALALSLAGPAWAQAGAHEHGAAEPHALSLNQGHKWATDAPLRQGMSQIRALVAPELGAAHAGRLSAAQYRALASRIEVEIGGIVAHCKLDPRADAMLHLVIADLGEGIEAMAGKNTAMPPARGLAKVALAINAYGGHFDDPGFAPIRDIH